MELSKNFEPRAIEEKWTKHWKEHRYFNSKPDERKPFTIVIPPPNVTGVLHMGHTLNETVQDILVRKARMSGFNACWVPGSDHASIATEAKVVEMLKEKGIDKNTISREKFLQYAFEWKEKYGGIIYNQIDRLGCSVDWDRVTFTMDDDYYKAVIKVFVDLYNKGLIYRGARMINWDPAAKTALSDEEVEYKEVQGKLYYVKYVISVDGGPMADGRNAPTANGQRTTDNFITIATQRPETIMGDTAVCVNPNDKRYMHLKGKKIIVPLVNREVPIIFDEYVDPAFGTGALKVTPAHDINDYNLGLKHNLPIIDTLNEDGTLSEAAEVFVGLDRFEARKKAIEKLRQDGLLIKEEEYNTRVGYSQRTNAVVEPRISTQWFVKMKELAEPALKEVTEGRINIHPGEKFLATYKYWLENVKDWCISRQLWWGQRIPAWYDEKGNVYVAETEAGAIDQRVMSNGQSNETSTYRLKQDQDVLDTWFSSWLWPIEVFKGITNPGNEDIKYYYPTSVLVTGQDIIFFWVARMIMAGMEYMKEKPFSDVYFTGMVRDKQGRKMSKQLGNSPDLLDLIDKYGADAVRFGIMISSPAGNDLLFDEASLEQGRNFNNKLWNALKLIKSWDKRTSESSLDDEDQLILDWMEGSINELKAELELAYFNKFYLSGALVKIYRFIWDDFCSTYLEWIKPKVNKNINTKVYKKTIYFYEQLLQLLHPFMPFITEEIYHILSEKDNDLCITQITAPTRFASGILNWGERLKLTITVLRDALKKSKINTKEKITIYCNTPIEEFYLSAKQTLMKSLNAKDIIITKETILNYITIALNQDKIHIQTDQPIKPENQKEQLSKDLEYQKGFLALVEKKLSNERFVQNAKPEVIEIEKKKKADAEAKIKAIEDSLAAL